MGFTVHYQDNYGALCSIVCTPEAVSAKTIKWQTQFCLEWQDFIFSGTHIDSDVFKKGTLENDSELMN